MRASLFLLVLLLAGCAISPHRCDHFSYLAVTSYHVGPPYIPGAHGHGQTFLTVHNGSDLRRDIVVSCGTPLGEEESMFELTLEAHQDADIPLFSSASPGISRSVLCSAWDRHPGS